MREKKKKLCLVFMSNVRERKKTTGFALINIYGVAAEKENSLFQTGNRPHSLIVCP